MSNIASLPSENAREPDEEAQQQLVNNIYQLFYLYLLYQNLSVLYSLSAFGFVTHKYCFGMKMHNHI